MYEKFGKRAMDIAVSLIALIILFPVLLVLTIVGRIQMKGNPFFVQIRPGKDEKLFKMLKFRSMTCEKDAHGNLLPDDKRLTDYGRFLRDNSLDELPELVNVLFGDLSLVGPRPQLVRDMVFMTPVQRKRHTVRQGLTGLAQINGRNRMTWEQKFDYDLQYISHISFREDMRILWHTVGKVFYREGVSAEGMETAEDFGDYLLAKGAVTQEEYDKKQAQAKEILAAFEGESHATPVR